MTKASFKDWFCLKDGHDNFEVDPVRDRAYLFGEGEWKEEIDARLRRAQTLKSPVRLVWWADFGLGKTHRLHYMRHIVVEKTYKYLARYVVMSDLQEKTGFEKLHYEMINSLGREEMQKAVSDYLLKLRLGTPNVPDLKELCPTSTDVQAAFKAFGSESEKMSLYAWRYLCGLELDADQELVEVAKPYLETSNEYSACLSTFAAIISIQMGKDLLYLVDEADKLKQITNKTAEQSWLEALRAMLDVKNVSFVFAIGAERQETIPRLILYPEIVRRIQRDNYKQMEAYEVPETKAFLRDLLQQWVDPAKRTAVEGAEGLAEKHTDYDKDLFPFTSGSFDKFCEWVSIDRRSAKPSEIVPKLNRVAVEAYEKDLRLITKAHLSEMGII